MSITNFIITDEIAGFRIEGIIHQKADASSRCEVWVYDENERMNPIRVRMSGASMLHVLNAATTEAIKRFNEVGGFKTQSE